MSATHQSNCSSSGAVLHMAFELSETTWKLGFGTAVAQGEKGGQARF